MQTTLNSSVRLWISYTNIPDLFPKSSAVQNFKRISVVVWCKTLFQGVHLSPETQNFCSNWLRKGGCFSELATDLNTPHSSLIRAEEPPALSPSYLLSHLAALQLLWNPQSSDSFALSKSIAGSCLLGWDFQQKHHNIHLWPLNPLMALNSTLPPDLLGGIFSCGTPWQEDTAG